MRMWRKRTIFDVTRGLPEKPGDKSQTRRIHRKGHFAHLQQAVFVE